MKRYAISKIVGTGTEDDPYRLKVSGYPDLMFEAGEIPSDMDPNSPRYGHPLFTWGLVLIKSRDLARIAADQDIDLLPDFSLDAKVSSMHGPTKTKMLANMQKHGIDTSFIGGTDGFREVVRAIGKQINPHFDENNFDVNE